MDDLVLRLEIVDMINETDSGAKDAARHIRTRLNSKPTTGACRFTG